MIVAPSGDLAAARDADGALEVVGKRFNAFAAEQWLTADGDARDPAQARDPNAPCDRLGSSPICRRASRFDRHGSPGVRRGLRAGGSRGQRATAPPGCKAKFVLDEKALARLGAVGLTWSDEQGFALTSDRSALQDRPWSPRPSPRATTGWCARAKPRRTALIRPIRATRWRRGVRFCAQLSFFNGLGAFFCNSATRHLGRGDKSTNT